MCEFILSGDTRTKGQTYIHRYVKKLIETEKLEYEQMPTPITWEVIIKHYSKNIIINHYSGSGSGEMQTISSTGDLETRLDNPDYFEGDLNIPREQIMEETINHIKKIC